MDNQRFLLLTAFGISVFMLWSAWQKQHGQPVPPPVGSSTAAAGTSAPVPSVPTALPGTGIPAAAPAATGEAKVVVHTDEMVAEISAQGGDLVRLELTNHRAADDKSRNLALFDAEHRYAAQSGLIGEGLPSHKTLWQLPAGDLSLKDGEESLRVPLVATGGDGVKVTKTYVFHRGSYLVDVEFDVANGGAKPLAPFAYFQLARDDKPPAGTDTRVGGTFTGPAFYTDGGKFDKVEFADIDKGKAKVPGKADNGWVAMVQHYFVTAWLPAGKSEREFFARRVGDGQFAAGLVLPMPEAAPGATTKIDVPLYAGPEDQDKLKEIAPGLDLVVDYGWLTVIAAPLFWILQTLHKLVGNWGWSIILLTVLIKAVFFPLSAASYKSMARMRQLTPKMMKLKETFADDKQRMNQEMMELYKREKVNPLGGCLPILVQIPVFIALYRVLLDAVEMRDAPWLGWIVDLSAKDPYYVLPLIMGATMLIQTKLNPTPPDPIQAKVMWIMPIVFTGMFLFFPAGLVLYWTVNNLLSIAQQWQVNRMIERAGLKAR